MDAQARYRCPNCRRTWPVRAFPFHCACGHSIAAGSKPVRLPPSARSAAPPTATAVDRSTCRHRGAELRHEECAACKGKIKIKVFGCGLHGECTLGKKLPAIACCQTCGDFQAPIRWLTNADLVRDTLALIARLPADLAGVVGVPRSGMLPASVIATQLHLPLFTWQDAIVPVGQGHRLSTAPNWRGPGPALVIDDTSYGGNTSRMVRRQWPQIGGGRELIFAAVYSTPAGEHAAGPMPDLVAAILQPPHFLEWNFFNSAYVPQTAFDFDGIFTIDGTTRPQHLPRKWPVELIVTGRFERDRAGSEAWLREHGIAWKRLVMYPGRAAEREQPGEIARYKAEHFRAAPLKWFVESDPQQAAAIARLSGKPGICPAAGRVF